MLTGSPHLRIEKVYDWYRYKVEDSKHNVTLVFDVGDHYWCDLNNQERPEPLADHRDGIAARA